MLVDYELIAKVGFGEILQNVERLLQMRFTTPTAFRAKFLRQVNDQCTARTVRELLHRTRHSKTQDRLLILVAPSDSFGTDRLITIDDVDSDLGHASKN